MSQIPELADPPPLTPPERLPGERIVLRRSSLVDAEDIFRNYATDETVTYFLPWHPHPDVNATRLFLQKANENWRNGTDFAYSIIHNDSDQVIGMISMRPHGHIVEMGYVLARSYWGQGIMTEALTTLAEWCLSQPEIWRVEAYCDVENKASARVMVKAGMREEGVLARYLLNPGLDARPRNAYLYARTKDRIRA